MQLGEKLSALRKQHSMTQMELAEKLGVSRQAISKWECGSAEPSADNLVAIGKLFEIPVEALAEESPQLGQAPPARTADLGELAGAGRRRPYMWIWAALLTACMVLSAIASVIVIHSAVFKEPADPPVQTEEPKVKKTAPPKETEHPGLTFHIVRNGVDVCDELKKDRFPAKNH